MAMAVDNRQQGHPLTGWGSEQLRYTAQPHFTNPWASAPAPTSALYPTSLPTVSSSMDATSHAGRPTNLSIPPYTASLPSTAAAAPPLGAGSYGSGYPHPLGASPTTSSYVPTSAPHYPGYGFQSSADSRRSSHPSVPSLPLLDLPLDPVRPRQSSLVDFDRLSTSNPSQRSSFGDALDASRGMVAMSQDLTPRNIYGNQGSGRNSTDSYGFPSTHSAHSSISSASTYPSYYNGSVDASSTTDYSSASESVTEMSSRTLPRPNGLVSTSLPPAPQSMMGQFSSKVSSSSQKKHKCKICDKRFTRPSSLQTHMYSHTGEKPFACEVEGCGRHFSVVSNLRRHRKVHKGERDHPSPDDA